MLVYFWVWAIPFAVGQDMKSCRVFPVNEPVCAYTGLNGNCTIVIDRLNPVTPPTVYARLNAKIKIVAAGEDRFR